MTVANARCQLEQSLKEHYKQKKCLKLSTLNEMDKLILYYMNTIMRSSLLSYDIIRIILLFYMYDLSNYEYISIFTKEAWNKNVSGHLSAFNMTNNLPSKKTQFLDIKRFDINCKVSQLFVEVYGTTFKLFSLNKFPAFIRNNLFPKYTKIISPNLNLHVLFRVESTANTNYDMSVSLIELDEHSFLSSDTRTRFDRCELLQSSIHGLISIGGNGSAKASVLQWNDKGKFEWNSNVIKRMKRVRLNHRAVLLENDRKIFVCGGNAGKTVELYNFESNKWIDIKPMKISRDCHGCFYDKNRNCVYALASYWDRKECERYDLVKHKWYDLPSLNHYHRWHPVVKMMDNENILMITGDFYKYITNEPGWGYCEYLDLREGKKWNVIHKNISVALNFDGEYYKQKYMRGLWLL
eukprot:244907_1